MAVGKKSFILYADQKGLFENLEDDEAGRLIKHIFKYVNDLNPEPDKITKIAFEPIKQQLKRDLKSWEEKSTSRSETGKLGGIKSGEARRKQKEANEAIGSTTKQNEHVNVNDNVKHKDRVGDKSPSLEERKELFRMSLIPFLEEFGKETLRAFFDYWSESNEGGKKMLFEMKKTFNLKLRLTNWKAKENDFKKPSEKKPVAIKPKQNHDHINS